jgi:predicted Na+-dependent transporter
MIVWLFAHKIVNIEFGAMIVLIGKLVIIPLVLAQIVRQFKNYEKVAKVGGNFNLVLLFLLVWSSIALARLPILSNINQFILASVIVLVLLIATVVFSVWFGRNRAEDITWAVSGTYKNFTLASVVALTMFGPIAMVGAAVYDLLDNILLVPIKWWATKTNQKN